MGCLIAIMLLFSARLTLLILWIFTELISSTYDNFVIPLLGFLFLPWTTLAYAWAFTSTGGEVTGGWYILIIIAILADIVALGGSAGSSRNEE